MRKGRAMGRRKVKLSEKKKGRRERRNEATMGEDKNPLMLTTATPSPL